MLCRRKILLQLISNAILICFSLTAASAENDFDIVCGIFSVLQNKSDLAKLSPQQRGAFVIERVKNNLDVTSNARVSWEAIVSAVPNQRYEIFKYGAEEVLGKPWTCRPMEQLAATAGEW